VLCILYAVFQLRALLYVLCAFVILNKDYLLTVDGRAFQLRGLEPQSAGQCDFRSVSVDLPPASENIFILVFLPLHCHWQRLAYSPTLSGSCSDFITSTTLTIHDWLIDWSAGTISTRFWSTQQGAAPARPPGLLSTTAALSNTTTTTTTTTGKATRNVSVAAASYWNSVVASKYVQKHRIDFKIANTTLRTLHSFQPAYLRSSLHACHSTRSLRLSNTNLLSAPFVLTSFGARSFSVAATTMWYSFSPSLRTGTSPDTFRRHLKTHYCQQAFQST